MELHVEPLNGGLVTARDPSLLLPGELTAMSGCYRPFSQSLWSPPASSTFASGVTAPTGLTYCAFDFTNVLADLDASNATVTAVGSATFSGVSVGTRVRGDGIAEGTTVLTKPSSTQITVSANPTLTGRTTLQFEADNVLVAAASGTLKTGIAGTTGTMTTLETYTEGTFLDSIHYANRHVLINGVNANRVLQSDGITRAHGLAPVVTGPGISTAAGTWLVDTGAGFYSYWTTEVDLPNGIESDFQGTPQVANVSTTSTKVTITRPGRVNASATHWRVYRSPKLSATTLAAAEKESIFPSGVRIAEVELKDDGTQTTVEDGGSVTTSTSPAGATTVVAGARRSGVNTYTWSSPNNASGNANAANATIAYNATVAYPGPIVLQLGGFGLSSSMTSPITGISVAVTARRVNNGKLAVQLVTTDMPAEFRVGSFYIPSFIGPGYVYPAAYSKNVPLTTSLTTHTLGSADDTWLGGKFQWTPGQFANGKFFVNLFATNATAGDQVDVDSVQVTVSYGKAQQTGTVDPFPAVTVAPFGVETGFGRNGQPPKASTGDIFQDSLVLNDVTDRSLIRYSFPGNIDAFPSPYFLNFETRDQDKVTNIKTLNNTLIVGLASQIYRVAYLPRETDAEFDRGRAVELIQADYGIVGPSAAATYTSFDGQQYLAFMTLSNGLCSTDGYRSRPIAPDINWRDLIAASDVENTIVVNNPELSEILVIYTPKGTSSRTGVLAFNYHSTHVKEGGNLKASSRPLARVAGIAVAVMRDGSRNLYIADTTTNSILLGNQVPTSSTTVYGITRQMYMAGVGNEWRWAQHFVHYTQWGYSAASAGSLTVGLRVNKTGSAAVTDTDYYRIVSDKTLALLAYPAGSLARPQDGRLVKIIHNQTGEAMAAKVQIATVPTNAFDVSLDYHVIQHEGQGGQDEF